MADATPPALNGHAQIRHRKQQAFLAAYVACTGNITQAAQSAKVSRQSVLTWRQQYPAFADALADADEQVTDDLEAEALRRAKGWTEVRVAADGTTYEVHKYSDTLLIFLLKGRRPEKYRESGKRDGQEISELLKAVLLELATVRDGQQPAAPVLEAEFQPWTPTSALPPPPSPDEPDEPVPWQREPTPW